MRAQLFFRIMTLAAFPVALSAQTPSAGYSISLVVSSASGVALPYATAAIAETGMERFTNANGELYFSSLAEGTYRIRVKQLGYSALDTSISVGPHTPNPRLLVRLQPIAFLLEKVLVTGTSKCPEPTDLTDPKNSNLALILGEVRKNAERHNLLLNRYPFHYRFAREFSTATKFLDSKDVRRDTIEFASAVDWKYEPGAIVIRDSTDRNNADLMRLPQLSDLADTTFEQNHCFAYRGRVRRDGEQQHQVDFIPLGSITEPDVEGSIFIDAKTYVLRSALFRLTGGDRFNPPLPETDVRTTFKEIYPNIVLFSEIEGLQPMFRSGPNGQGAYTEVREKQKLIGYTFLRGAPGDQAAAARYDSAQAAAARRDSVQATLGSVGGTVFGLDKNPIANARIVAGDADQFETRAGKDGKFILGNLPPGETEITVSAPGFSTIKISVEVSAGKLVTVALVLYPES
jgi:hypothetical protein